MHTDVKTEQTMDQAARYADLAGKTYLVTGASSGIGAATALALGKAGANVVLAARRLDACGALAAQIQTHGGQALALPVDVTVEQAVHEAVKTAVSHFGGWMAPSITPAYSGPPCHSMSSQRRRWNPCGKRMSWPYSGP